MVPPTCGDYDCRDYYIDLGFIPDSQFQFPCSGGQHTILVTEAGCEVPTLRQEELALDQQRRVG